MNSITIIESCEVKNQTAKKYLFTVQLHTSVYEVNFQLANDLAEIYIYYIQAK